MWSEDLERSDESAAGVDDVFVGVDGGEQHPVDALVRIFGSTPFLGRRL